MERPAFLAISTLFVFCLFLGAEDALSRGGRGMSRPVGVASRSPSMSSYSGSRSFASQQTPTRRVVSQPQRPPGRAVSPGPGPSGSKLPSTSVPRVDNRLPEAGRAKPSQGQVRDFLNLPQQGGDRFSDLGKVGVSAAVGALGYAGARELVESKRPGGDRPGVADRPGVGDRLQAGTLPAERPGADRRPGIAERPGAPDRPVNLPARPNADQIRDNLHGRYDDLFTPQWWKDHPNMAKAYWQNSGKYQYAYNQWWKHATWASLGGWVAGSSWSSPEYYDYGESVYYQDEQVYVNGKPAAGAQEYYQQAGDLAAAAPTSQAPESEWLPLGIFAISRDQATDSNTLLQLAVDKNGVIAGTYYNTSNDTSRPVKGSVDKKTQRAAWTFADGKNTDIIMETGVFNLTQDQTEALVHFGPQKTQQWLMVRLDQPKNKEKAE
jgi:hypothetical protein